jgi:hypothetical protein
LELSEQDKVDPLAFSNSVSDEEFLNAEELRPAP